MNLVLIEWLDSNSCYTGWNTKDQITSLPIGGLRCRSVGWLVKEARDHIVIVAHIGGEEENGSFKNGCGDMMIPKVSIVSRKPLWETA